MKELKEIYHENPVWEERRFQLVKDLCSAAVIKDGVTKVRGSHVNTIISTANAILEKLYPGEDLLKAEKSAIIEEPFGNKNGKLGDFNYEKDMKSLFSEAKSIEFEKAVWDKDEEPSQLRFLVSNLLEQSPSLAECSDVFFLLSYIREEDVLGDLEEYFAKLPNKPNYNVLHDKGGYSRDAILVTITK